MRTFYVDEIYTHIEIIILAKISSPVLFFSRKLLAQQLSSFFNITFDGTCLRGKFNGGREKT
jgi:hypothetical protein